MAVQRPTASRAAPATMATPAAWLVLPTPPLRDPTATIVDPRLTRRFASSASALTVDARRAPSRRVHAGRRSPWFAETCGSVVLRTDGLMVAAAASAWPRLMAISRSNGSGAGAVVQRWPSAGVPEVDTTA